MRRKTLRSIVTATSLGYYVTQQISPTCGVTQLVYKGMRTKYKPACIFGIITSTSHANRIHVAPCRALITESTSNTYNAINVCLHVQYLFCLSDWNKT
jgi:hypothetical protein